MALLLARVSSEPARTRSTPRLTKNIRSAAVIRAYARALMASLESVTFLNAIDNPAHLAPASLEYTKELIRMAHLNVSLQGKTLFGKTFGNERYVSDRRIVGCEMKLEPSFQPVVVSDRGKKLSPAIERCLTGSSAGPRQHRGSFGYLYSNVL